MKQNELLQQETLQQQKMEGYYRFQAKIYDSTRWSFLFGRHALIHRMPALDAGSTILEVGCGTGYNLVRLAKKYPQCLVFGLDISETMIEKSGKKSDRLPNVRLINEPYGFTSRNRPEKLDAIVFSYTLSMINPQWSALIDAAQHDLRTGGHIAVVDFEYSRFGWFRRHMQNNHVRMEKHLVPYLEDKFFPIYELSQFAYGRAWQYFTFIGKKN